MALLGNQTLANERLALYGSGSGPSGGELITNVSTIQAAGNIPVNVGPAGLYVYTNGFADENSGFEVYKGGGNTTVAQADFDAATGGGAYVGARGYSTIGGNQVIDTIFTLGTDSARNGLIRLQHEYAGISTISQIAMNADGSVQVSALPSASGGAGTSINLSAYTSTIYFQPQGAQACHSKVAVSTNTYVPQAGTTQNLGAFTTLAGHLYDVRLPVRIDAVSQPAAGDWAVITTDTATAPVSLATFDMTQVSSVGNQYEVNICGSVIASGTTTTIMALGKLSAGTSTAVTVAGSAAFIRDLGIPQSQ